MLTVFKERKESRELEPSPDASVLYHSVSTERAALGVLEIELGDSADFAAVDYQDAPFVRVSPPENLNKVRDSWDWAIQ